MQSQKTEAQFTLLVRFYRVVNEIEMMNQFILTFHEIYVIFIDCDLKLVTSCFYYIPTYEFIMPIPCYQLKKFLVSTFVL